MYRWWYSIKGYIFRLYPTDEKKLIEKSFSCFRYILNYFLDKTNGRKYIKTFDYIKDLPPLLKKYGVVSIIFEKIMIEGWE